MSPHVRAVLVVLAVASASSCANFEAAYTGMGPANQSMAFAEEARVRFDASEREMTPADLAAASRIDIYFDAVPPQLVVDGSTISLREGANAELLGSVLVMPLWLVPDQAGALPVMQRAVYVAGANLAYCPRESVNWRCFLVRTLDAPAPPPATSTSTSL